MQWTKFSQSPEQLLYSRLVTERSCPHPALPLPGAVLATPRSCEDSLKARGWISGMCELEKWGCAASRKGTDFDVPAEMHLLLFI